MLLFHYTNNYINHTLYFANMSGVTLKAGSINACIFFLLILKHMKINNKKLFFNKR